MAMRIVNGFTIFDMGGESHKHMECIPMESIENRELPIQDKIKDIPTGFSQIELFKGKSHGIFKFKKDLIVNMQDEEDL